MSRICIWPLYRDERSGVLTDAGGAWLPDWISGDIHVRGVGCWQGAIDITREKCDSSQSGAISAWSMGLQHSVLIGLPQKIQVQTLFPSFSRKRHAFINNTILHGNHSEVTDYHL